MLGAIMAFFIGVALLILPIVGKQGFLAKTNKVGVVEVNRCYHRFQSYP